jgi:hypothetical protein
VRLGAVLSHFLADSGVRTRGLPWNSGAALPVTWETPTAVASEEWLRRDGITLMRSGTLKLTVGRHPPVDATLSLMGTEVGLQRVSVSVRLTNFDDLRKEELRGSLTEDGYLLQPLKCDAATEGYGYGNLVFVGKAPGKTASGLHESWNCPHDGCDWTITILYRRADVVPIECASPG